MVFPDNPAISLDGFRATIESAINWEKVPASLAYQYQRGMIFPEIITIKCPESVSPAIEDWAEGVFCAVYG